MEFSDPSPCHSSGAPSAFLGPKQRISTAGVSARLSASFTALSTLSCASANSGSQAIHVMVDDWHCVGGGSHPGCICFCNSPSKADASANPGAGLFCHKCPAKHTCFRPIRDASHPSTINRGANGTTRGHQGARAHPAPNAYPCTYDRPAHGYPSATNETGIRRGVILYFHRSEHGPHQG